MSHLIPEHSIVMIKNELQQRHNESLYQMNMFNTPPHNIFQLT
jgi:hypothetical protein